MTVMTYRLQSAAFVYAPGLIAWAINGAKFQRDRAHMAWIVSETWAGVPTDAALALVTEAVPFTLDGETVVFEVPQ